MTRTAIVTIPRIEPHRPPTGAAIVAKVCQNQGHTVRCYDLNIEFFDYCKKFNVDYHAFDGIWDGFADPNPEQEQLLAEFINSWANHIAKQQYDRVLFSIFGVSGIYFAERFLRVFKPLTTARVAAGGMGVSYTGLKTGGLGFGAKLRNAGLIDDYTTGEGEIVLIKYFNGEEGPGINNEIPHQVEDLDSLPWPDYSFYELDRYDYLTNNEREVFITGSRGCVRKCTYCDIERYWPKFRYRSGQNIANEIIQNYEEHGITRYYFTDSLVNGSLKAFRDMCNKLAAYNFPTPIHWGGQYIFRPESVMSDDDFKMIKAAGGDLFFVGFETGSDRLRFEMGKKFTNADIDYQLEQFSRNRLKVTPLMFTGYITETPEDHQANLDMFARWQRYVADGTINGIDLGISLIILPGAPVERMIDSHGLTFMMDSDNEPDIKLWQSSANPDLTIEERIRRKIEIHEQAIKYAWPVWRQAARLNDLKQMILKNNFHKPQIEKKFFPIKAINSNEVWEAAS
jgi:radical SAM superfamily enzyme YgiQ (UPF0313 family)